MTERPAPRVAKRRLAMILAGGIAGVVVGLAGVYGFSALTGNAGGDAEPAGRRSHLAKKLAPLARGEVAAVNIAKSPLKLPDLVVPGRQRQAADPRQLARPHGAAQPVGHLVRALPQGNAGARRAAGQAGRPGFPGGGGQYRHPRSGKAEGLSEGIGRRPSSPITPIRRQDLPGSESRSAAPSACRPPCWSTRKAAKSAPSRAPPNGRATTRSS